MDNAFRLPIRRLRALIEPWIFQTSAPRPDGQEHRAATHLRKGFGAAAGVLLIAPAFLTWIYIIPIAKPDRRPRLAGVQIPGQPGNPASSPPAGTPGSQPAPRLPDTEIVARSSTSELPPLAPDQTPESQGLFLLAAGNEFMARIDPTTGSGAKAVNAIVEADIYDTRTGNHLILPRATRLSGTYVEGDGINGWPVGIIWETGILPDGRRLGLSARTGVAERPGDDLSDRGDGEPSNANKAFLVSAYQPVAAAPPSGGRLQDNGLPLLRPVQGRHASLPRHSRELIRVIVWVRHDILLPAYSQRQRRTKVAGALPD